MIQLALWIASFLFLAWLAVCALRLLAMIPLRVWGAIGVLLVGGFVLLYFLNRTPATPAWTAAPIVSAAPAMAVYPAEYDGIKYRCTVPVDSPDLDWLDVEAPHHPRWCTKIGGKALSDLDIWRSLQPGAPRRELGYREDGRP